MFYGLISTFLLTCECGYGLVLTQRNCLLETARQRHTHTHMHTYTRTHTLTHSHTHTRAHAPTHAHTPCNWSLKTRQRHTHTHIHTHIHAHTHTRTTHSLALKGTANNVSSALGNLNPSPIDTLACTLFMPDRHTVMHRHADWPPVHSRHIHTALYTDLLVQNDTRTHTHRLTGHLHTLQTHPHNVVH